MSEMATRWCIELMQIYPAGPRAQRPGPVVVELWQRAHGRGGARGVTGLGSLETGRRRANEDDSRSGHQTPPSERVSIAQERGPDRRFRRGSVLLYAEHR